MSLAVAITAAGLSSRFEGDKLSYAYAGTTIGDICISLYSQFSFIDKVIVLNPNQYKLQQTAVRYGFRQTVNFNPADGLSSSVRLALDAILSVCDPDGILFAAADMPFVQFDSVSKLISLFESDKKSICVPICKNTFGKPVIFPRDLYKELSAVKGDIGGRTIIRNNPARIKAVYVDQRELIDIDTVSDAKEWLT